MKVDPKLQSSRRSSHPMPLTPRPQAGPWSAPSPISPSAGMAQGHGQGHIPAPSDHPVPTLNRPPIERRLPLSAGQSGFALEQSTVAQSASVAETRPPAGSTGNTGPPTPPGVWPGSHSPHVGRGRKQSRRRQANTAGVTQMPSGRGHRMPDWTSPHPRPLPSG